MTTGTDSKGAAIRHQNRVRELYKLPISQLRLVEARRLNELGSRRIYGEPHTKDEWVSSILELEAQIAARGL